MSWEDQLWTEMEEKSEPDKIIMAGSVITHMMRDILPALADKRRLVALKLVESGEYTATKLAETIGARPGTITRLLDEGRAIRKRDAA